MMIIEAYQDDIVAITDVNDDDRYCLCVDGGVVLVFFLYGLEASFYSQIQLHVEKFKPYKRGPKDGEVT